MKRGRITWDFIIKTIIVLTALITISMILWGWRQNGIQQLMDYFSNLISIT